MSLVVFLITIIWSVAPRPARVVDLDGDGHGDQLALHAAADGARAFVHATSTRGPLAAGGVTSPLYPAWKAVAGRLDGSGQDLVVLGTWTTKGVRPGDPPRRSVWVVALEARAGRVAWVERWRGSRLARPFDDFTVRDLDGDGRDELVVRECAPGQEGFAAYAWQGFGFTGRGRLATACHPGPPPWDRLRLAPQRGTTNGGRLWISDR